MTHRVVATRQEGGAMLRCAICRSSVAVGEGDFETTMNRFVGEHKLCLDASA